MIGLDTNVLVRYIMQDDPKQSPKATRLIENFTNDQPGFVPLVAVVELVWVLSSSYGSRVPSSQALFMVGVAHARGRQSTVQLADPVHPAVAGWRLQARRFRRAMR